MRRRSIRLVVAAWACLLAVWPATAQEPQVPRPAAASSGDSSPWLGVWLGDAVDGGVQVLAVVPGGPADSAGVLAWDVVLAANGRPVGDQDELGAVLRALGPGDRLDLDVVRSGQRLQLEVELGRRSQRQTAWSLPAVPGVPEVARQIIPLARAYEPSSSLRRAGLQVSEITPALRVHYGAPEQAGVLVTRVEPGQPAERAGFAVGDVLVRIGEQEISSEQQVRVNLVRWDARQPLRAQVIRSNRPVTLTLDVEPAGLAARGLALAPTTEQQRVLARNRLLVQIERLERRLRELKQELEELESQP